MGRLKVTELAAKALRHGLALLAIAMMVSTSAGLAHEVPKTGETGDLPSGELSSSEQDDEAAGQSTIIYHRIGDLLDRVTVERSNGIYEVYQNSDSKHNLWNANETELGDRHNVRQWRLVTW